MYLILIYNINQNIKHINYSVKINFAYKIDSIVEMKFRIIKAL
jgi:hypothetical protein